MSDVKTVVLGERPPELEALIARRKKLGLDLHDEVWEGVYHVAPYASARHAYIDQQAAVLLDRYARSAGLVVTDAFNLGGPDDFRVPDRGLHRGIPEGAWVPTAAAVVEILSADDESLNKLPFYASRGVEEVLIFDPDTHEVGIYVLKQGSLVRSSRSDLLRVDAAVLEQEIDWP